MNEKEINEISIKLRLEAQEFYKLAKEFKRANLLKESSENFLLNRLWLTKWKKYVDYKTIKEQSQNYYSYSNFNRRVHKIDPDYFPGEIDNNFLLVPLTEFLNDGDENNPENQVVRHNIDIKNELKIINKRIWQFFQERYGGGPSIEKPFIVDTNRSYSSNRVIEVFYRKVNKALANLFRLSEFVIF